MSRLLHDSFDSSDPVTYTGVLAFDGSGAITFTAYRKTYGSLVLTDPINDLNFDGDRKIIGSFSFSTSSLMSFSGFRRAIGSFSFSGSGSLIFRSLSSVRRWLGSRKIRIGIGL